VSKEAATRLETLRMAVLGFISTMDKAAAAASGNKLAAIDAEYNAQIDAINNLKASEAQKNAMLLALDTNYAAQRTAMHDSMLGQIGISDEEYRTRNAALIEQDAQRMITAGMSVVQAEQFKNVSLLEQQAAYLEAKNTAISEDYLTQDEITLARDELERVRLETAYADKLISEDQFRAAMYQREVTTQAALGSLRAQTAASQLAFDKMTQDQKLKYVSDGLSGITTLMQSKNKEQFAIGKAAAIAQATINAYTSATQAYKALSGIYIVGPVLGAIAAAAAVAAGMANVSKIRSQQMGQAHAGMTSIPSEGTFLLSKGERVIQPEQNRDLTQFLNGRTDSGNRNDTTDRNGAPVIVLKGEGAPSDAYVRDMLIPAIHSAYGDGVRTMSAR
jgi:hypothetical protein